MKGVLIPDHIPLNNFELRIQGMPPLLFITMSGLEEELDNVDLPDRTAASGGHTKPLEFTATMPLHHALETTAVEMWFLASQEPVRPNYKKNATLILKSISNLIVRQFLIMGMFPCKRKTGDLDMNNEGELHTIEWTFRADRLLPI